MTTELATTCDLVNVPRSSLIGFPCGRPAVVHILGRSDARVFMLDRCSRHAPATRRQILAEAGGTIVKEEDL